MNGIWLPGLSIIDITPASRRAKSHWFAWLVIGICVGAGLVLLARLP